MNFISFKDWLNEADITKKQNLHMTHAEDLVILGGTEGLSWVIDMFKQLYKKLKSETNSNQIKLSIKFDGAPALFCWSSFPTLQKNGIAIKALFAKDPKIMYNNDDVEKYYGQQPDLAIKLKLMLKYIPSLGIPENQIWQGDFLFDKTTLKTDNKYYSFHPNTIVYKVNKDSELGQKVSKADIGIVWHTRYTGTNLTDIKANYNTKTTELNDIEKVFMTDPYIPSLAGIITLTKEENQEFQTKINEIEAKAKELYELPEYNSLISNTDFTTLFTTFQNSLIKRDVKINTSEEFLDEFAEYITNKFDKEKETKKTDKGKEAVENKKQSFLNILSDDKNTLNVIISLINNITNLKTIFIKKLNNISKFKTYLQTNSNRFIETGEEGFAVSDIHGNVVKLVDRYEFSFANFSPTIKKGWQKI